MVILKILAWNDRPDRDKHASDVLLILRHYHEAGQFERLYENGVDLLAAFDYDIELAGAALLGQDARRDISTNTLVQVRAALADGRKLDQFSAQALRSSTASIERTATLLAAFLHTTFN